MIILLISQCCDSHLSGANSSNPEPSLQPFMIYEKVQGTGAARSAMQEIVDSNLPSRLSHDAVDLTEIAASG